jgi:hypothetical protein
MKSATLALAALLAAGIAGVCEAQDLKATPRFSDTQIGFDPGASYNNYTLSVGGPNGFVARAESKTGTPTIDLRRFGTFDDGTYSYHLSASSDEKVVVRSALDNGRDGGATTSRLKAVSTSGEFLVKGGMIVKADPAARENVARQK